MLATKNNDWDVFYLTPTDGSKSFYRKATVIDDGSKRVLKSYNTIVAEIDKATNELKLYGWYSQTTCRHINSFLSLHGIAKKTKKEILALSTSNK